MASYFKFICVPENYEAKLWGFFSVMVVEGLFYFCVTLFGFVLAWRFLWKQKLFKFPLLSLLYFFGQMTCVTRLVQCGYTYWIILTAWSRQNSCSQSTYNLSLSI